MSGTEREIPAPEAGTADHGAGESTPAPGKAPWKALRKARKTDGPRSAAAAPKAKNAAARRADARRDAAKRFFSSPVLFVAGLACMPALLFNPSPLLRVAQAGLFLLYAWSGGKRIRPLFIAIASATIVGFNLLIPVGRVLATWGSFRLTEGALMVGIERAATLEGLILLSRATIRSDLKLPGGFGSLLAEAFRLFELISERRGTFDRRDPIGSIDLMMLELSGEVRIGTGRDAQAGEVPIAAPPAPGRRGRGYALLFLGVAASWALFGLSYLTA